MSAGRATLPRTARLRGAAQFTGAFPQQLHSPLFLVLARNNTTLVRARLGIVIGRRNAPRAVDRSRMKRMVREEFRQLRPRLRAVDLVVRIRAIVPAEAQPNARTELRQLLLRAGA